MGKDAKARKKGARPDEAKGKPKAKPKAKVQRALPLPADAPPPAAARVPRRVREAEGRHLGPLDVSTAGAGAGVLDRLWQTVECRRLSGDVASSHSARLMARGTAKVAQKLGEEAVECVIEATQGNRDATVMESADLLYHLIVVWVDAGIRPEEVWAELKRREGISGIAEKASRPKGIARGAGTTKLA